jgi:MFS family permease
MYQTMSMEEGTPFTGASPAQIDLIGTLAAAFQTIFAPVATAWTKRFSPRRVIFLGATLFFTASMLASYSVHIWQFLLTQGFLLGLATCFSYLPAATIAPTWYTKHRGVAMGIILSGTGIGGLVWAPVIHILNEKFGFRIALRIAGSVTAAAISVGGLVLDWDPVTKKRLAAEKQRLKTRPHSRIRALWEIPLVDWRIARSPKFVLQLMSSLLQASGYFTPVFFFC